MTADPRGYFVAVAVMDPAPGTALERLPQKREDFEELACVFDDLGYDVVNTSEWAGGRELSAKVFASEITNWLREIEPGAGDSVVFYFFGHGLLSQTGKRHYLCFSGCKPDAPGDGGLPVADLTTLFLEGPFRPGRVWFILDCCFAGLGGSELAAALASYRPAVAAKDSMTYWVTTSSGKVAQYADGKFREALASALPKSANMEDLQRKVVDALGRRAVQRPETNQVFGNTDFLRGTGAPAVRMPGRPRVLRRRPRSRRRLALIAAAVAVAGGLALFAFLRTSSSDPDMVRIGQAQLLLGAEEAEARRVFTECRSSLGEDCGDSFESSLFAREVRAAGAAPRKVPSFYLDKTEVSLRAFVRFLNAEGPKLRVEQRLSKTLIVDEAGRPLAAVRPASAGAPSARKAGEPGIELGPVPGFRFDEARADRPVTLVSWHGARRFCEANGKRLPTEEEWELAARGPSGRRFPWGEQPPAHCNEVVFARGPGAACSQEAEGASPVGRSLGDVTPEGLHDLGGNVTEWTASSFSGADAGSCAGGAACRVLRGGNYDDPALLLRASTRFRLSENEFRLNIGFRCARDGAES